MSQDRMAPRLGLVSFLNARPIGWGLLHGRQRSRFEVVPGAPSALADALSGGEIDLALLPSYEYARGRGEGRDLAIVPGICIASNGPAESVLLFSRVPSERIRRVAVDLSSRTSAALLRILFRRAFRGGRVPEMVGFPPELPAMLEGADAALLIGDPALFAARRFPHLVASLEVRDLGAEWLAMTGLPFVYAFWAGPRGKHAAGISAALADSLQEGVERIPEIAREAAEADSAAGAEAMVLRYLKETIRFVLGPEEIRGLETFFRMLVEDGELPAPAPALSFHPMSSNH